MADDKNKTTSAMALEVGLGGAPAMTASFAEGADKPSLSQAESEGFSMEFGKDGTVQRTGVEAGQEEPEAAEGTSTEPTAEGDQPTQGDEAAPSELPAYEAGNEEVHTAYEQRFFTFGENGEGTLNLDALMSEWEANAAKEGSEGGALNEGTYAFLTAATGISKEAVKEIEAGRVALREKADAGFYERVGGKDAYDAMLAWATGEGGYTEAQRSAFNSAVKAGGSALEDQLDALANRYAKATGTAQAARRSAPRRPASPGKTVTPQAGPTTGGVQPFKSNEEYHAEARSKGFDNAEVRKRLEASTFWR